METRAHDTSDSARYNAEFKYIRTDDHRLVGDLLDEAFPLSLANVEVERRHKGRQREEEQQRGQRRRVQRRHLHAGCDECWPRRGAWGRSGREAEGLGGGGGNSGRRNHDEEEVVICDCERPFSLLAYLPVFNLLLVDSSVVTFGCLAVESGKSRR